MTTTTEAQALKIAEYVVAQFPDATDDQRIDIARALLLGEIEICPVCNWTKDLGGDCDYCYAAALEAEANSHNDDDYNRHAILYPQF